MLAKELIIRLHTRYQSDLLLFLTIRQSRVDEMNLFLSESGIEEENYKILAVDMASENGADFERTLNDFLPTSLSGAAHLASPFTMHKQLESSREDIEKYTQFARNTQILVNQLIPVLDKDTESFSRLIFAGSFVSDVGNLGGLSFGLHKGYDRLLAHTIADNLVQNGFNHVAVTYMALGSFRSNEEAQKDPDRFLSVSQVAEKIEDLWSDRNSSLIDVLYISKQDEINRMGERLNPRNIDILSLFGRVDAPAPSNSGFCVIS